LVLCTGFSYDQPVKEESSVTLADRRKNHVEFNEKINKAKSILIAGAGVVGVEVAAELAAKYGP